jgi:transposase
VPQRTQAAAEAVLQTLTVEQRHEVVAVAADMLPAYASAVANEPANAELVHDTFRITNATSGGFNSAIQALNDAARGFRSFQNYKTRILFFCCRAG